MKILKSQIVKLKKGKNLKIISPVNIYEAEFGDNCFVGPFTEIQKGVKIGDNTRVQSHSFICELVRIGKNCFIGHGVVFINDKFKDQKPANGKKNKWLKTLIGSNVNIGSNSTILPVKICSNVVIGAGSVVTKNVEPYSIVGGVPAKTIRWRFELEVVKSLIDSQWWELDYNKIKDLEMLFNFPLEFVKNLKKGEV